MLGCVNGGPGVSVSQRRTAGGMLGFTKDRVGQNVQSNHAAGCELRLAKIAL